MVRIIVTLDKVLKKLNISPYKLAIESKIRPNTIYDIMNNKKKMINLETMAQIVFTINQLSKESGNKQKFTVEDFFKYIDK